MSARGVVWLVLGLVCLALWAGLILGVGWLVAFVLN